MHFRTEINIPKSNVEISHRSSILSVGSCFADNIGNILSQNKFKTAQNPFGILYNPISICNSLCNSFSFNTENFTERDGIWYSFDCHSEINATSKNQLLDKIKEIQQIQTDYIKNTDVIIITFGSAFVYEKEDNKIVANCHKLPAKDYKKRLLAINEITEAVNFMCKSIVKINPNCRFIFTISPVRHIKDTIELNNVSKSILRLACHQIAESRTNCTYFPAFEIMIDDLRDYRFYEKDMLHPTQQAIEYIWRKFAKSYFSNETNTIISKWEQTLASINHRSFNTNTVSHQQFLSNLLKQLAIFETYFDVSNETKRIQSQLI